MHAEKLSDMNEWDIFPHCNCLLFLISKVKDARLFTVCCNIHSRNLNVMDTCFFNTLQHKFNMTNTYNDRQLRDKVVGDAVEDQFGREKERIVTYSECVSVAIVFQHAKRMRRILLSSMTCLAVTYFPHVS